MIYPRVELPTGTSNSEQNNESTIIGQEDLRELQDYPPQGRGARDLQKPQAQAAARVRRKIRKPKSEKRNECGVIWGFESRI